MKKQQLTQRLLDIESRKLGLVGYEIHDGLCQQLSAAVSYLEMTRDHFADDPWEARRTLEEALQAVRNGLEEARRLVAGLRPPRLDRVGFARAIEQLAWESHCCEELSVAVKNNLNGSKLPPSVEDTAYRIIQESLTNVARHSGTQEARLELVCDDGVLRISVEDRGVGFDPAGVAKDRFGLEGMQARAALYGGNLTIDSAPGRGTRVRAEIPLSEERSEHDVTKR